MVVGVPKEIKTAEHRVSMPPHGVDALVQHKHTVYVEKGAGLGSGFSDQDYLQAGATLLDSPEEVWEAFDMIIKVKEPMPSEFKFLRPDLTLTYLHLAADEALTRAMLDSGVTGLAHETIEDPHKIGVLPLLEPMSEIAGRMATQVVSHCLEKQAGGRGVLMGGVPGTQPARVVVLGGGTVGTNAAKMALGMGANVTILDVNLDRLRYLDDVLQGRLTMLYSDHSNVAEAIQSSDAVIASILIAGTRAPKLITRDMLGTMKQGSVIVDVAVDQGGCVETTAPATHDNPTFVVDGVLHYGVANMPGAVLNTSSLALSNATIPYALRLANLGFDRAVDSDPFLAKGVNVHDGKITYKAVADAFDLSYQPISERVTPREMGYETEPEVV